MNLVKVLPLRGVKELPGLVLLRGGIRAGLTLQTLLFHMLCWQLLRDAGNQGTA